MKQGTGTRQPHGGQATLMQPMRVGLLGLWFDTGLSETGETPLMGKSLECLSATQGLNHVTVVWFTQPKGRVNYTRPNKSSFF